MKKPLSLLCSCCFGCCFYCGHRYQKQHRYNLQIPVIQKYGGSGKKAAFDETSEQEIDGRTVTFNGKDGKIYLATWNYNNFAYTISLDENAQGASAEEMTEYVKATR